MLNSDKTKWFNQQYLQLKGDDELTALFLPILEIKLMGAADGSIKAKEQISNFIENNNDYVTKVIRLIKERATFVADFWDLGHFFFVTPTTYDDKSVNKAFKEDTPTLLAQLNEVLNSIDDFSSQNIQNIVKDWITSNGIGFGKVMMPLRVSLVGSLQGPDVFDIMGLIGKEETMSSINNAIKSISV